MLVQRRVRVAVLCAGALHCRIGPPGLAGSTRHAASAARAPARPRSTAANRAARRRPAQSRSGRAATGSRRWKSAPWGQVSGNVRISTEGPDRLSLQVAVLRKHHRRPAVSGRSSLDRRVVVRIHGVTHILLCSRFKVSLPWVSQWHRERRKRTVSAQEPPTGARTRIARSTSGPRSRAMPRPPALTWLIGSMIRR
jgi:hypothetical protein